MILYDRLQLACREMGITPETEVEPLEDCIEALCYTPRLIEKRSELVLSHKGKMDALKKKRLVELGPFNLSWVRS